MAAIVNEPTISLFDNAMRESERRVRKKYGTKKDTDDLCLLR